jgi:hypothetical protein
MARTKYTGTQRLNIATKAGRKCPPVTFLPTELVQYNRIAHPGYPRTQIYRDTPEPPPEKKTEVPHPAPRTYIVVGLGPHDNDSQGTAHHTFSQHTPPG